MADETALPLRWDLTGEDALIEGAAWERWISLYYMAPLLDEDDNVVLDEHGDPVLVETVWETTGYTATMTIRDDYDGAVLLSATTANGLLVTGASGYTVKIALTATATDAPALDPLKVALGVYDLWLYDTGGNPTAVYTGRVALQRKVTP